MVSTNLTLYASNEGLSISHDWDLRDLLGSVCNHIETMSPYFVHMIERESAGPVRVRRGEKRREKRRALQRTINIIDQDWRVGSFTHVTEL